ncbi:hypothetical protein GTP38_13660 [Duganella sp. FT94W]|uniref:Uncharacterized protein n=1 Tax=Duganella lactea TaxID=2692173 RepID=A0ABW9V9E8_9BURK|nr:hypothetical protein [Duganella lactea]MYM35377.1 hypothetical protein [Duganella lactea]
MGLGLATAAAANRSPDSKQLIFVTKRDGVKTPDRQAQFDAASAAGLGGGQRHLRRKSSPRARAVDAVIDLRAASAKVRPSAAPNSGMPRGSLIAWLQVAPWASIVTFSRCLT